MFGAANQLLGTLALCIATTLLIKMGKAQFIWVTAIPMVFVGVITLAGCYELWWMFLDRAAAATESVQSMTMYLNAGLVGLVAVLAIVVLTESMIRWYGYVVLKRPYTSTEIVDGEAIRIPAGPCC